MVSLCHITYTCLNGLSVLNVFWLSALKRIRETLVWICCHVCLNVALSAREAVSEDETTKICSVS